MRTSVSLHLHSRQVAATVLMSMYAIMSLGSMATMSIGIACVLLAWAILRPQATRIPRGYLLASVLLTLALALSLVVARLYPLGYGDRWIEVSFLKDIFKAWYLFWPMILIQPLMGLPSKSRKTVFLIWLAAAVFFSFVGIQQAFTGFPKGQQLWDLEPLRFHVTALTGFHLSFATIYSFPFFLLLQWIWNEWDHLKSSSRALAVIVVLVMAIALLGTFSRTLWVALPVGFALWMGLNFWFRGWRKQVWVGLLVLGAGFALMSRLPMVQHRMGAGDSYGQRAYLWEANFEFFKARFLTGSGWHHNLELSGYYLHWKYPEVKEFVSGHAHNNAIEMLGSTGLLGFIAWLFWCGIVIRDVGGVEGRWRNALLAAWLVFHLNGFTQVNFWESKVLHTMMWMVAWSWVWVKVSQSDGQNEENASGTRTQF